MPGGRKRGVPGKAVERWGGEGGATRSSMGSARASQPALLGLSTVSPTEGHRPTRGSWTFEPWFAFSLGNRKKCLGGSHLGPKWGKTPPPNCDCGAEK